MIEQLPKDQADLIVYRLGKTKVAALGKEYNDNLTAFYASCLSAMGPLDANGKQVRVPSPGKAWLEILGQRFETNPTLSHPKVSEVITYFGGWKAMWEGFNHVKEDTARNRFVMAFKELAGA